MSLDTSATLKVETIRSLSSMADTYAELSAVNVLRELGELGWTYDFVGEDEVKCCCPAHGDKSPSLSLNTRTKLWKCHAAGCGAKGDFISFMALATKGSRSAVIEYIRSEYSVESIKTIDPTVVEKYHERIWSAGPLKQELYARGLNDDTIRQRRLGVDDNNRISIPITNKNGAYVNIRRYRPGAPSKDKMKNTRGMGKVRLYPHDQLSFNTIIIAGGECKALVLAQELNKYGIGAVCATAGEDNWEAEFSPEFKGKRVYVCYDIDEQGQVGGSKICARVKTFANWVGQIRLPLDIEKYPHGDVNDYFGLEHHTADEFLLLLESTLEWVPTIVNPQVDDEEGSTTDDIELLPLSQVTHAQYAKKRIITKAVITAMDTTPYLVPRDVAVECDRNQPNCAQCPVYAHDPGSDFTVLTINRTSPAIIELVNAGKKGKRDTIREGLRIPACKTCVFHERTHYNVEDVRLSPQLEISSRTQDGIMLPALTISHGLEMNVAYELHGRTFPHPRTQQAILLVGQATPAEDALDTYKPSDEDLVLLKTFQPTEWTVDALQEKLETIYTDLSANITRIFDRFDLHLIVDLAFHSPLLIPFDGRLEKGWAEVLVIGDSAQGKSEVTKRLMEHYGLGEKIEVKNASVAGLLGGLAQMGNRWMVQWGVIPRHDRRLVVLEELKGASIETISKLTDMRSSGIAELDKIEKRRTHARTRLIALSNPRSDQPLASYSYGVEAVRELIGSPEDLRRFDAVLTLSASQVDPARLNLMSTSRPVVTHQFTPDLCKRAILWAWSRLESQVEFEPEAEIAALEHSNVMCKIFVDVVPIVDRGSMRFKLARLAAGLAGRTASFGSSPQILKVRKCHVDYVASMLMRMYCDPVCGYMQFSEAYRSTRALTSIDEIRKRVLATPYPTDFLEQMLHRDEIEIRDICDWTSWERNEATTLLSFLVRKHALIRDGRAYRKNPSFIELIRALLKSDDLTKVDRPNFIGERGHAQF